MYSPIIGKKEYGDKSVPLFILLEKIEKMNKILFRKMRKQKL
jgi:hypothetical protein